jgi:PmbA protein
MSENPPRFNPDELKAKAQEVLAYAKKLGATAAEASIAAHDGFSINVRRQETEELIYHHNNGMCINVYNGQKQGTASCSDLTIDALKASVEAAWAIAQQTGADPYAGLADPLLMATDFPDLQNYYPWDITPEQAIELAKTCEQAAFSSSSEITNSDGAYLTTQVSCDVYANTHHFCHAEQSTYHSLSCTVVAEKNGHMQRDYSYIVSANPKQFNNVETIGIEAATRTRQRLGAKPVKTQSAAVIFAADVARGLFGHFVSAISGNALYRRASFLLDHLDKQIFPEFINICERPYLLSALASSSFDAEGVATRNQDFITAGRLERYVLNSYSARRLNLETTANAGGVHNLIINHSKFNLQQLLKKMGTGLLITELLGQGANLITGDYSRGASGFWVENGEIAYPVAGVTVSGNLKEIYRNILAVGNDVDIRGNIRTGSIWVESMVIGGES